MAQTDNDWQPLEPRWPGLRAGRSLIWPLPPSCFAGLAPERQIDGVLLRRKREFHTTLLDTAMTARLAAALASLPRARSQHWRREVLALDWRWRRTGECWLIARAASHGRPAARSVVELIDQPAQVTFRERVGVLLDRLLPPPVPHVTVYTHGDHGGIGLPDPETFQKRSVRQL